MADLSPEDKKMSDAIGSAITAFNHVAIHGQPRKGDEVIGNWDHITEAYNNLKETWKSWTYNKFFPE